jgi:hypothetical protein
MCPIHSAGRRRLGHLAGGVLVYSHWRTVRLCCRMHCTHHNSRVTEDAAARYQYCMHYRYYGARRSSWRCKQLFLPSICPWGHVSGLRILVCAPLNYKREGTLRTLLDSFRLKLTSNTTHNGVGYYAPAAQTTLNPCVFLCVHPPISNKENA